MTEGTQSWRCVTCMKISGKSHHLVRCLWKVLAPLCRPNLPTLEESIPEPATGSMGLLLRVGRRVLGRHPRTMDSRSSSRTTNTMDNGTKKKGHSQKKDLKKIQKNRCRRPTSLKGQRQEQWTRYIQQWAHLLLHPWQTIDDASSDGNANTCAAAARGQAVQKPDGHPQEAQRSVTSRSPIPAQRSCDQGRSTANQTSSCSCCSTRSGSQKSCNKPNLRDSTHIQHGEASRVMQSPSGKDIPKETEWMPV